METRTTLNRNDAVGAAGNVAQDILPAFPAALESTVFAGLALAPVGLFPA